MRDATLPLPATLRLALAGALVSGLAACASGPTPTVGTYKVGQPYQINGVWYYPRENTSYSETGLASWYGEPFHGRRTANGETFDKALMTAAHQTLPMPVLVRVTNLRNGRSTVLRVNDRGPFVAGRIIDVSEKAAELLGFKQQGTAPVRVEFLARAPLDPTIMVADDRATPRGQEIVEARPVTQVAAAELPPPGGAPAAPPPRPAVSPPPPRPAVPPTAEAGRVPTPPPVVTQQPVTGTPRIYVQAGAFASRENAERLRRRVASLGSTSVVPASIDGQTLFRVRVGPLASDLQADAMLERVLRQGIAGARIIVD